MAQKLIHSFQASPKFLSDKQSKPLPKSNFKKRSFALLQGEEEVILGWLAVAGAIQERRPLMDKMS